MTRSAVALHWERAHEGRAVDSRHEVHLIPAGREQRFLYCVLRRLPE